MTSSPVESPGPVTADDVRATVDAAIATLRHAEGKDWQTTAGGLTWSCWETVEHMADDLFAYAGQLAPATPALTAYVPFGWKRRPDGPALTVHVDADQGVPGLLQVLDASGGLLAALVRVAPPEQRGFHPLGLSDGPGFAAMGLVEVLVHMADVARALDLPWSPEPGLCARVLYRLFPDAPGGTEPWPTLLWATGRGELPGHAPLTEWRWYADVRG